MNLKIENFDSDNDSFFNFLIIALSIYHRDYFDDLNIYSGYATRLNNILESNMSLSDNYYWLLLYKGISAIKTRIYSSLGGDYNYGKDVIEHMVTGINNRELICNCLENYSVICKMFGDIESTKYYFLNSNESIGISPSIMKFISKTYSFVFNIFRITENGLIEYECIENIRIDDIKAGRIFDVVLILKNDRYYFVKLVKKGNIPYGS